MKQLTIIAVMVLVVAACNLSDRFKKSETSSSKNSSGSDSSGSKSGDPAEKPNPTAAQIAALANGQDVKWDEQGISWTLPPGWKKQSVSVNNFQYDKGGAFLIVTISALSPDFPTDLSLNAFSESAKVRKKNGEVDEVKWLALDGLRGIEFRESKPQMAGDIRRLQWMTYRKYANQTQLVNFILSTSGGEFDSRSDELYAILYSTKLVH
ncbi:MAG TPA: hypothetical protein VKD91_23390 [Pyrinomonadaceae bacterium]|nr:hypothetical protein [Pyrinomonadaceae bacterium]